VYHNDDTMVGVEH